MIPLRINWMFMIPVMIVTFLLHRNRISQILMLFEKLSITIHGYAFVSRLTVKNARPFTETSLSLFSLLWAGCFIPLAV